MASLNFKVNLAWWLGYELGRACKLPQPKGSEVERDAHLEGYADGLSVYAMFKRGAQRA